MHSNNTLKDNLQYKGTHFTDPHDIAGDFLVKFTHPDGITSDNPRRDAFYMLVSDINRGVFNALQGGVMSVGTQRFTLNQIKDMFAQEVALSELVHDSLEDPNTIINLIEGNETSPETYDALMMFSYGGIHHKGSNPHIRVIRSNPDYLDPERVKGFFDGFLDESSSNIVMNALYNSFILRANEPMYTHTVSSDLQEAYAGNVPEQPWIVQTFGNPSQDGRATTFVILPKKADRAETARAVGKLEDCVGAKL